MKKAIYIHGLGSDSNSSTGQYIKNNLKEYDVLVPTIPFEPFKASKYIFDLISKEKPGLVIASSLGAFYVMIMSFSYPMTKLLINPAMKAYSDIKDNIGLGYKYSENRVIDNNFLEQLKYLEDLFYGCSYEYGEYAPNTFALFGSNDELFSHIKDFKKYFDKDKMKTINANHSLNISELRNIIDFVEEIKKT